MHTEGWTDRQSDFNGCPAVYQMCLHKRKKEKPQNKWKEMGGYSAVYIGSEVELSK
jgi:hypothetical protein